jgi:glycosyltransferase involved in cell wall biosynthesis
MLYKEMKIAIIGQKGIPAKGGGVERHVEELATRLVSRGNEVFVYTRPNYTSPELKEYKGVNLISKKTFSSKNFDAISHTFIACLDLIFKRKVDVIHFHSIGPSSLILFLKIFKPKTPIVATFHSQCYLHKKWGFFAKSYLKLGEFILCKFADKVISVSKNLKKYAFKKHKREAIYIPNGVNKAFDLMADLIKKWGLRKDNYIFLATRLIPHKGIHYLIKAFNNINTDKKLVIAGNGSYTDDYVKYLKEISKNNKNIIFTGNQTGKILTELFSNAYFFVQPSESEGLSFALLEGMSYGPVLASDIPENIEAVGEAGFTFKNKNIKDLEDKIKYLLNNKEEVKKVKDEGREKVNIDYNWENITDDVLSVYEDSALNRVSLKEEKILA